MNIRFFVALCLVTFSMRAMDRTATGKMLVFGVSENREAEVDNLMTRYLAQDELDDERREFVKKHLIAMPQEDYFRLAAHLTHRGVETEIDKKDKMISALFAIAERMDKQNSLLEGQLKEMKQANAGQDENDAFAREQFTFAKYSWKVGTVLGALGTITATALAIWPPDPQC